MQKKSLHSEPGWSISEILNQSMDYYNMALQAFTDPVLQQTLGVELIEGALIGQDVALGEEVIVEEGAVILGKTKILRGKVAKGAVVVDCVARVMDATRGSLLLQVEQLNEEKVTSKRGESLTDIIIMDDEIVQKIRIALDLGASLDMKVVVAGRQRTIGNLLELSHFEAPYMNGSNSGFRQVLLEQTLNELFGKECSLTRFDGNPVLEPIPEHPWESKLVYNPAAIRLNGTTYIVYRAFGVDHISCLGLAWSRDGLSIDGRLPYPIFSPEMSYELAREEILQARHREKGGCEDPRLTLIGGRIYITYSAYSDVLQIALASITKEDFIALTHSAEADIASKWTRHGPLFPGFLDRNAILFPEKINGKYALLRRPMAKNKRDIAITFSDSLEAPWSNDFETIIGVRPGMWDSERVGAGAPALKTRHGWLLIFHGVGIEKGRRTYMLGVALLDLNDPRQVLYRSPNPIFIPTEDYELYGWAPTVVFTNGAVARMKDATQIIEDGDDIMVYYGGGDRVIGVAWAKLSDLIPESLRI